MDWFQTLTGFKEETYAITKARLQLRGDRLHSTANGRDWGVGRLETPNLNQLRVQSKNASVPKGKLSVQAIEAEALQLHVNPDNKGALFQVASQFNLLEMMHYSVTPEQGVTRYESDPTQGPTCAVAAGGATIYRNYFAPVAGQEGQTTNRQINTLSDLMHLLGKDLIEVRNGYALSSNENLKKINERLDALNETELDEMRQSLRIGVHWNVEVTAPGTGHGQLVTQAFCSALPVAYNSAPAKDWQALSCLVLDAAYEATLCAAALNAARGGSSRVYLTLLGGGVFGNPRSWILQAIERALYQCADLDLSVFLVSHGSISQDLSELTKRWARAR